MVTAVSNCSNADISNGFGDDNQVGDVLHCHGPAVCVDLVGFRTGSKEPQLHQEERTVQRPSTVTLCVAACIHHCV